MIREKYILFTRGNIFHYYGYYNIINYQKIKIWKSCDIYKTEISLFVTYRPYAIRFLKKW